MASPGKLFREAVRNNKPLQLVGAVNAYTAILAEKTGYQALYLSGSGVATSSYGIPDLGITTLNDVVEDARRITSATKLPILVDVDTGFGQAFSIARMVREMERAGVAAIHIEDQMGLKRCGHRPNKQIVTEEEMVDRIRTAVNARTDKDFVIMARTDALANEGIESAIKRSKAYIEAGADMLFPEAVTTLEDYKRFVDECKVPVLANITEFGKTPLFTTEELSSVGVSIALYPLSAFRAMSRAALNVYQSIKENGTQKNVIDIMQPRTELYEYLEYHKYEDSLDNLFKDAKK
ncbi:methylisocitrate lyase [Acrasis kona]|uniref:Methylisocitrate lyase n=1 Tax=Acrasis kona TaxID=1008807 RepID=A0AAW2YUD6_9EUKA